MSTEDMIRAIDEALPDAKIEEEVRLVLREGEGENEVVAVEVNEETLLVPVKARIEVLTKTFVKENYDLGFHTGYRAQVAIGGVAGGKQHELRAVHCFATLFFNRDLRRITIDFHASAAWL